jgi:pimeloyl-ACP methyl ester carboxylesterase
MEAAVPNLRRIVLLPACGHWTQQEHPGDVNDELLDFLRREQRSLGSAPATS